MSGHKPGGVYSKPWHEYLARCQHLLQNGRLRGRLCYITEEGAYMSLPQRDLNLPPPGYDYDLAPPDACSIGFSDHGRIALPDGMSYAALVLPNTPA